MSASTVCQWLALPNGSIPNGYKSATIWPTDYKHVTTKRDPPRERLQRIAGVFICNAHQHRIPVTQPLLCLPCEHTSTVPVMLALVYDDASKSVELKTVPKLQPEDEEALIKVHRAGICATVRVAACAHACSRPHA